MGSNLLTNFETYNKALAVQFAKTDCNGISLIIQKVIKKECRKILRMMAYYQLHGETIH